MRKRYNIFIISRLYLRNYYKYIIENTDIVKEDEAYSLFIYSMKKLYDLDTVEYSNSIVKYGEECIEYLRNIPDTPKNKETLSFEDRVRLVSVCEGYAEATKILTRKVIKNGRLKED